MFSTSTSKASSLIDFQTKVWRLENKLRPSACRVKEVTVGDLYRELCTEHGYLLAMIKAERKTIQLHRLGHPRWF